MRQKFELGNSVITYACSIGVGRSQVRKKHSKPKPLKAIMRVQAISKTPEDRCTAARIRLVYRLKWPFHPTKVVLVFQVRWYNVPMSKTCATCEKVRSKALVFFLFTTGRPKKVGEARLHDVEKTSHR